MMLVYLTDEDYAKAEENGIDRKTMYQRVYIYGWALKRALSTPKRKAKSDFPKWRETCTKNGIGRNTFNDRVRRGYTPEEAATKPVSPGLQLHQKAIVTQAHLEKAAKNGIKPGTVKVRVYQYHWTVERAITEPTHTKYRRKS